MEVGRKTNNDDDRGMLDKLFVLKVPVGSQGMCCAREMNDKNKRILKLRVYTKKKKRRYHRLNINPE